LRTRTRGGHWREKKKGWHSYQPFSLRNFGCGGSQPTLSAALATCGVKPVARRRSALCHPCYACKPARLNDFSNPAPWVLSLPRLVFSRLMGYPCEDAPPQGWDRRRFRRPVHNPEVRRSSQRSCTSRPVGSVRRADPTCHAACARASAWTQ
jgi:hypothetical protein